MDNKFIIDVIPLTRIPLTRNQSFYYLSERNLDTGSLVSIPLFRREVEGIVLGAKKDFPRFGNIQLKKVIKVIFENLLTEEQIKLAKFISDYYISPLGIVMKNFVPKRAKVRSSSHLAFPISYKKNEIKLTNDQNACINKISNTKFKLQDTKYLLFGPASSGKTDVYIHSILEIKKKNPEAQFLILLPELTLTPQAMERYGAYFSSEEIVVLSSNISKGQLWENWLRINSSKAKIIIGTRMAVFAPFKKLGLIVIDEEQDISFKQWDMNPRYDARVCAEKLAQIFQCPLVRGSATPSVESYYKAINKGYKLLKLPHLSYYSSPPAFLMVDMRKERWEKNYSSISKTLKSEIAYALKYNRQIILFLNRQGMSAFSVCANCKNILRCPNCDRAMIYNNDDNYKCLHCTYKTSIIPQCPKCKGIVFKNVGLGTEKTEREIENIFTRAKILRADRNSMKWRNAARNLYSDFSLGKASILIGTQIITKGWDLRNVSLIGIIDADNLFSFPDIFTSEKAFQNIAQISGRTNRVGANFSGKIVIQTFQPENKILKIVAENKFEDFYKAELAERKALNFPPFGKSIKIIFQDTNFKKVSTETQRVFEILNKLSDINISEPQDAFVAKIRGRFRRQMIIKYGNVNSSHIKKELAKLGPGWIIDVDPISIL